MTEGMALELAKQTMCELGVGENYLIRFRHFQIPPSSKIEVKAQNELLILIKPYRFLKVYSKAGIYNELDVRINEMQYIHRGITTIINQMNKGYLQVKLLQVIPKLNIRTNGTSTAS
ncbi:MAG: hypothetical protein ACWA41_04490 [Putridiphycobacter sp.]